MALSWGLKEVQGWRDHRSLENAFIGFSPWICIYFSGQGRLWTRYLSRKSQVFGDVFCCRRVSVMLYYRKCLKFPCQVQLLGFWMSVRLALGWAGDSCERPQLICFCPTSESGGPSSSKVRVLFLFPFVFTSSFHFIFCLFFLLGHYICFLWAYEHQILVITFSGY